MLRNTVSLNASALEENGFKAPSRLYPHTKTLIAWPTTRKVWGPYRQQALDEYAALVGTIARFEPVTVIADPAHSDEAKQYCSMQQVDVLDIPIDDSWIRDSGPLYLINDRGQTAMTQFCFNAWGQKYTPYNKDAELASRIAKATATPVFHSQLVMEGGGLTVDGEGTLITTASVVMNPNRNAGWSRAECERELCQATGAKKVLWLENGLVEDRDTDGHSDNVVQFAAPGKVIVQVAPNRSNPNWEPLRDNLKRLQQARDAQGRKLEIIEIPQLPYTDPIDGERYAVPYVNFYPVNGAIVAPHVGTEGEEEAFSILSDVFEDREVVGAPSRMFAYGGGGIGCVTQHVPVGTPFAG